MPARGQLFKVSCAEAVTQPMERQQRINPPFYLIICRLFALNPAKRARKQLLFCAVLAGF
jgi:hypothetical protein